MLSEFIILVVSLAVLLYSADQLIDTVVKLAKGLNVSTMVVGLTVVAIGTSLPELMASSAAAIKGHPNIAVGNVIGSNVCNVGLILGLPALFFPILCRRSVLQREGVLMLLATAAFLLLAFLGGLNRLFGGVFVLAFIAFVYFAFQAGEEEDSQTPSEPAEEKEEETERSAVEESKRIRIVILKMMGFLVALLASSEFLVRATVSLASAMGVSEGVIAISMIAFGTSLPELSVSIAAAKKNQGDILVGNILGSNISNILLVLGATALITPFSVHPVSLYFDLPLMSLLAVLMLVFLWQTNGITRHKGMTLLGLYGLMILRCAFFPEA